MVNALACTVDLWLLWGGLLSSLDRISNPLPFYISFLTEKVPLFIYPIMKNGTPFTYLA